ncbi:hypothetical protein BRC86_06135 [Halobacteriales archaeon QS_3_64_16]|nr:MAG: hypothetical protein BRC86_06135 [Halobacteriales archaeon QS_3_64_16]
MGANTDPDHESNATDRPSLAAMIRDAEARGETEATLIDRVRASYDRELSPRRVSGILEAERERLDRVGSEPAIEDHAPRYVDSEDLASLTDAEFARVIAHLLDERDGHAEVLKGDGEAEDLDPTEEQAGRREPTAGNSAEDDRAGNPHDTDGVEIRWHRSDGDVVLRAFAPEPGRLLDGQLIPRANGHWERGLTEHTGTGDALGPAVVTVADLTPSATRLAVRLGVALYDRADVRRWLEEEKLTPETFGSLIEPA